MSVNPLIHNLFRFEVELSEDLAQQYAGKTIFVYGIHPSGDPTKNRPLNNWGRWVIP